MTRLIAGLSESESREYNRLMQKRRRQTPQGQATVAKWNHSRGNRDAMKRYKDLRASRGLARVTRSDKSYLKLQLWTKLNNAKSMTTATKRHAPWSEEDCRALRNFVMEGMVDVEIGKRLGRTVKGISGKRHGLGLVYTVPQKGVEYEKRLRSTL